MKKLIIAILFVLLGFVCFVQADFDQEVVAATLIMEAGGEYDKGALEAVYEVIHNRAKKRGTQYSDECLRRLQFSCWNGIKVEDGIAKASKHPRWNEAMKIASSKPKTNYAKGADHYHADYVNPYWAKKLQKTSTVGRHIFYK